MKYEVVILNQNADLYTKTSLLDAYLNFEKYTSKIVIAVDKETGAFKHVANVQQLREVSARLFYMGEFK
jgi:hypothetical protein